MIWPSAKISPYAVIFEPCDIGQGCIIWQFATVLTGATLGIGVSVGGGSEIGKGCQIGDYTRISAHVFLPANTIVEERCFVGPGCVFTDDRFPRAGNYQSYDALPPYLESGCSIGAGSVILPGVRVGKGALVGAGSVVTRDVPPHEHVRGEPARTKALSTATVNLSLANFAPPARRAMYDALTEEQKTRIAPAERAELEVLAQEQSPKKTMARTREGAPYTQLPLDWFQVNQAERDEYASHMERWYSEVEHANGHIS